MTRHLLPCGCVLSLLLVSTTLAQQYANQSSAQERVSQLRPGWSREGLDPTTNRARYVVAPAPIQMVDDSETGARSFLPKWLTWPGSKPEPQKKQTTNNQRQNAQKAQNGAQQRPPAENEAAPPDPATIQDGPLPGLGGSPLPRANRPGPATPTNAAPKLNGATSGSTQSSAPQRSAQAKPQASGSFAPNLSGMRTASREPAAQSSSTNNANKTQSSTTRNSPGRRTAPHITPDELRRELSGTFPATSGDKNADAGQQSTSNATAATKTNGENPSDDSEAVVSDTPVTLPTTSAGEKLTMPAVKAKTTGTDLSNSESPSGTNAAKNSADGSVAPHYHPLTGGGTSVRVPMASPATPPPQTMRGKEAFGDALQAATGGDPNVLASNQTPVLTADIRGPKQILVGRESTYRVRLQNLSDVLAEGVVVTVKIPTGAEVVNSNATQGSVQPAGDPQSPGQLQWHLARLDRRGNETLELHLIPRESRPLELGVTWTLAPVASRAVVEVQEAKLNLEITGPTEVLFDKPQTFKLTISNPGTGIAENVKIDLIPPGGSQDTISSHSLGDLAAGTSQTLEVELTPREAGKMIVKAIANGDGGLTSDASKEIFCRKPELEVDWRGPATKYTGTLATYFIRVRNPGTAPAEDVVVSTTLPDGAEFTSASEGQSYDAARRAVTWHVGTLGPGDDNYMELKCVLKSAGKNMVKISAANGGGDLTDAKTAETNVVAIADLKLDVTDPSGPVAVGAQATYEIHVRNRGASSAKEISVVALFSEGIEPEQAEGAQYSVSDGRVSFKTIDELAAGREAVLKIRAHAVQPGTHIFRAEVLCKDLEIKLAAEETTRFYADDVTPSVNPSQKEAANRSNAFSTPVK